MKLLKLIIYVVLTLEVICAFPFSLNATLNLFLTLWIIFVLRCLLFRKVVSIYNSLIPFSLFFISFISYSKFSIYSYQQLSLIFVYISIFILSQDLIPKKDIKKLIQFLGLVVLGYTLVEALWILPYLKQVLNANIIKNMHHLKYIVSKQRTTAFFLTPNNLGIFLLFTLYAFWEYKNRILRHLLSIVIIYCLITTKSIGVWICLSAVILLILFKSKHKKYALGGIILCISALTVVIWLRKDLIFNPHNLFFNPFYQRAKIWERSLMFISQKPILGYGIGNFPILYNQGLPHHINQEIYAHNLLLQFWFEAGLMGYIWILLFYLFSLKVIFEKFTTDFFLTLCCITFLIHNLFDASFYLPKVGIFFWIFIALLLRPANRHNI